MLQCVAASPDVQTPSPEHHSPRNRPGARLRWPPRRPGFNPHRVHPTPSRLRFVPSFALFLVLLGSSLFGSAPYRFSPAELDTLAAKAPAARQLPIQTVVDKAAPSPSGDAHDYISYARYYWPDPKKPDGRPFINRDGHHNEEQVARGDHARLGRFFDTVTALAADWHVHRNTASALRAGEWVRAWLLTPETRLTPALDFAQIRLGHDADRGTPYGILDARGFASVVDALRLLDDSPAFAPGEIAALREWFDRYLTWLTTSKNGRAARAAKNNHGTWYLAQVIPIARYCGHDALARALCDEEKQRIATQIAADGSQPDEVRRADGLSYSVFNLDAHFEVARQAAGLGIDLWNYSAPNGASLRRAYAFLAPFNANPDTWPASQHAKRKPGFLDALTAQARLAWPDLATDTRP